MMNHTSIYHLAKKKVKARFMNFGLELLRDHVTVSFPKINELGNSSM